jgi:hypothetical protein
VDIQRVMDLRAMPDEQLAGLRGGAEQAGADYSLLSWTGPVPEELIEQAAALFAALNDAPHYGLRTYAVAAVQADTGEPAAITEVAVDPADPGWGHQMLTGVTRAHRGHRLGQPSTWWRLEVPALTASSGEQALAGRAGAAG